jgi:hypothetical protein
VPRDSIWEETSEKASERRHLGGDIWEEKSEERHLRGLWKELWERLWEGSGRALGRLWGGSGMDSGAPELCSRLQKLHFLLILRSVFEGTPHQVRSRATFARCRFEPRVGKPTKGSLSTPPRPYKLKLFRE